MDKFVVRRPASSPAETPGEDETARKRRMKRVKTEHEHDKENTRIPELGSSASPNLQWDSHSNQDDTVYEGTKGGESSGDSDDEEKGGLILKASGYEDGQFGDPPVLDESLGDAVDESVSDAEAKSRDVVQKYHSSYYVDAFNMALDAVLETEAHLFNEKEKAVFNAWRHLDYEAQYLYVRLFLRKEAAWHRTERLGYHSHIADLQTAVDILEMERDCSNYEEESSRPNSPPQGWALGSSFTFTEPFSSVHATAEDSLGLLCLDELKLVAKQMKAIGKTKPELKSAILHMATKQLTLSSVGLYRDPRVDEDIGGELANKAEKGASQSDRVEMLLRKIAAITGPCIRISPPVFKLFERVHLVFYRTSEWSEKSLMATVLAKMSKWSFPVYAVSRTANIFESRDRLLDFEEALRLGHKVDRILTFGGPPGKQGLQEVVSLFDSIMDRWRSLLKDHIRQQATTHGFENLGYLLRFTAAHVFTRIAHYAASCLGRLHDYRKEYDLLNELLNQRILHLARRGAWYQRRALLEERYMVRLDPALNDNDRAKQKRHWAQKALDTRARALQDPDCHVIYHYDLQKRIVKLEKRLRVPRRLQHEFGHLQLLKPEEHFVEGVQIKGGGGTAPNKGGRDSSARTIWLDELEDGSKCTVEEMCLNHYRRQGWKGCHSEGGIVRTLFAYLFFDILFLDVPNVFQTAFQTCPLDLHTDVFYTTRASEINRRLVEIANGEAARIVRDVHASQFERRTCIVGLKWQFELEDLAELAECFNGDALALVCKVLAQEYQQRGGGLPDLLLWRMRPTPDVLFSEVKSANDRLSDTQRMWIHVLAGSGVRVAVCHATAKEVRIG